VPFPKILRKIEAEDGACKFLLELWDRELIEAVLIPAEETRETTLCLSVQVGCKYGCGFCRTATMGFKRNLESGEMLGEYLAVKSGLTSGAKIHRLVFMGMGEPLDNLEALKPALEIFCSRHGIGFSPRRITISTAGVVPALKAAWSLGCNLAVSLNAAENEKRKRLMPITRKYPLPSLLNSLRSLDLRARQKLTIEYVMLKAVNDSQEDAQQLVKLLSGIEARVNLIRFNPFPGCVFRPSEEAQIFAFQNRLRQAGFRCFIRKSRGAEILAGCGQLAGSK
jgi:23S rRNA (adenine2503-C2)-methyltransferase